MNHFVCLLRMFKEEQFLLYILFFKLFSTNIELAKEKKEGKTKREKKNFTDKLSPVVEAFSDEYFNLLCFVGCGRKEFIYNFPAIFGKGGVFRRVFFWHYISLECQTLLMFVCQNWIKITEKVALESVVPSEIVFLMLWNLW